MAWRLRSAPKPDGARSSSTGRPHRRRSAPGSRCFSRTRERAGRQADPPPTIRPRPTARGLARRWLRYSPRLTRERLHVRHVDGSGPVPVARALVDAYVRAIWRRGSPPAGAGRRGSICADRTWRHADGQRWRMSRAGLAAARAIEMDRRLDSLLGHLHHLGAHIGPCPTRRLASAMAVASGTPRRPGRSARVVYTWRAIRSRRATLTALNLDRHRNAKNEPVRYHPSSAKPNRLKAADQPRCYRVRRDDPFRPYVCRRNLPRR